MYSDILKLKGCYKMTDKQDTISIKLFDRESNKHFDLVMWSCKTKEFETVLKIYQNKHSTHFKTFKEFITVLKCFDWFVSCEQEE